MFAIAIGSASALLQLYKPIMSELANKDLFSKAPEKIQMDNFLKVYKKIFLFCQCSEYESTYFKERY